MENEIQRIDDQSNMNPYPMYLLIVAGQTFSKEEKQSVLDRIHSGNSIFQIYYISLFSFYLLSL